MGIVADNLLHTLKSLGDVSAGLSVPISRLALNFGQVKTQGKLTGRELRDFSIAGVPLISALVDVLNDMGGTTQMVGETSKKVNKEVNKLTKAHESAEKKVSRLNLTLKKQKNRLAEMIEKEKEGTAAFKNLELSIIDTGVKLLEQALKTEMQAVRLIGIGVLHLVEPSRQATLFTPSARKLEELNKTIDRIRNRYGFGAIQTGRTMQLKDILTQ